MIRPEFARRKLHLIAEDLGIMYRNSFPTSKSNHRPQTGIRSKA